MVALVAGCRRRCSTALVAATCLGVLALPAWSQAPESPGTVPEPRTAEFSWMPVSTWYHMFADDVAVAEKGGVDLLFVGDSITALWDAGVWQRAFGRYHAANFGIGGDHTGNVLWRLRHGQLGNLHPKVVVLLIGVNNFGHLHETPEQVYRGIRACVEQLRASFPQARILVNGVFPFEQSANSVRRADVAALNRLVRALDDQHNVFVADYGWRFLQPDGSISRETMADFLHPTARGYQAWADALGPDIDRLMKLAPSP